MASTRYKRKIIVINPAYQYGLAGRLAGWVVFIMLVAMGAFYILAQNILSLTLLRYEIKVEDPANLVLIHSIPSIAIYLVVVAIFTGLLCLLVVRYTHRVWGPIYRFQQTVQELRKGNLALRIVLREGDSCERLAEEINGLIAEYAHRLGGLKKESRQALAALHTLQDPALAAASRQLLENHLSGLDKKLAFFQIARDGSPREEKEVTPAA